MGFYAYTVSSSCKLKAPCETTASLTSTAAGFLPALETCDNDGRRQLAEECYIAVSAVHEAPAQTSWCLVYDMVGKLLQKRPTILNTSRDLLYSDGMPGVMLTVIELRAEDPGTTPQPEYWQLQGGH